MISSTTWSQDLFPIGSPWMAMYAMHILRAHLEDQVGLGVADENFIARSIRLLANVLLDADPGTHETLLIATTLTLLAFLRGATHQQTSFALSSRSLLEAMACTDSGLTVETERPIVDLAHEYFEAPTAIVKQACEVLRQCRQRLANSAASRLDVSRTINLAHTTYLCLLEGVRISATFCAAFVGHEGIEEEHKGLLLQPNCHLSCLILESISKLCAEDQTYVQ